MLNIKFYLDSKADKQGYYPIHLFLRKKDVNLKISTGEKIQKTDWDKKAQAVLPTVYGSETINSFLNFLNLKVQCNFFKN